MINLGKILKYFLITLVILFFLGFYYLFIGHSKPAEDIKWGVNFSQKHSEKLGLDWQEVYLALLNDLRTRNLKISVDWDLIEPEEGNYSFDDLDWQIKKAEERGAKILLVIGMKTGRWPECHIPKWAENLPTKERQEKIIKLLQKLVLKYRESNSIWGWQVENEPFFPFGECPKTDKKFLKKEIDLVKSLDSKKRPVIISDTGELSLWFKPAELSDIVGITMYRKVWSPELNLYISLPYPPVFYWRRVQIIKNFFNKEVVCVELQTEPWVPNLLYNSSIEEQQKTMDLGKFRENIEFAKKTGLDTFYLWGAEWWYWMKEKQNEPEIWNEAKKLFQ